MNYNLTNKKFLFEIAHPKHFYQFKPLISKLSQANSIKIIARNKDVVLELLNAEEMDYTEYGIHGKKLTEKLLAIPTILADYKSIIKSFKPDYVISRSSPYAALLRKFHDFTNIILPDSEVVPLINKFVAPNSDIIITPKNFTLDYGKKHYRVSSVFEAGYLKDFKPEREKLTMTGIENGEIFFIIRFVGWYANHDIKNYGFNLSEKMELINLLKKSGRVYISSESNLPGELKGYQLKINPADIHHYLHYAFLYVGDSQTMATEAALLGTPSFRYNSFVGDNDMSNFKLLENKYRLMKNFSSYSALLDSLKSINNFKELKMKTLNDLSYFYSDIGDINNEIIKIISENIKN